MYKLTPHRGILYKLMREISKVQKAYKVEELCPREALAKLNNLLRLANYEFPLTSCHSAFKEGCRNISTERCKANSSK